jgi:hypothetical protein
MSLQQRIKKIEIAAQPLAKVAATERRRSLVGRFGMCRLLCWGFTRAESLDVLERANRRKRHGGIDSIPHFTAEYIPELFQSFLAADSEAAQLYQTLTVYRTDGEHYEETIKLNAEQMTPIVAQLLDRLDAYFMETARADFFDHKRIHTEARQRMEANNEQSEITNQQN